MDDVPLGNDTELRQQNQLLGMFDGPAYIRRARAVEAALESLLAVARKQREEWLKMPRLRLGQLAALAGEWGQLSSLLTSKDDLAILEDLHAKLRPQLRVPLTVTSSQRALSRALEGLIATLVRFNERWQRHLDQLDPRPVNQARDGYNRYYLLEKSCALRSDVLARMGFSPLQPLDRAELERHLPLLPVPRLARR